MFVSQIYLSAHSAGYPASGSFHIKGDDAKIELTLTEDEAAQLTAMALNFFEARQQKVAQSIADMRRPMLSAPTPKPENIDDADFEVIGKIVEDDDEILF